MQKHYFPLLLFLFTVFSLQAQGVRYGSRVTLEGTVIDAKTQQPVAFANIGFVGKGIGTVSNEEGNYTLVFAPATLDAVDRLQFSVIGYKTRVFSKNEALQGVGKPFRVSMIPEPYDLNAVVLEDTSRRKTTIGDLDYDDRLIGYWKDKEGLGGEILTKLKVRRKNTRLERFKFKVKENYSDSILVRLNVYDVAYGLPNNNLLDESITQIITTKNGVVEIPLEPYNIIADKNIIIGIELLKVYSDKIGFSVAGSVSPGWSYLRDRSQDNYKKIQGSAMAYQVDVAVPYKGKNLIEKREVPESIVLYWDASVQGVERDISKELDLLKNYLGEIRTAQVSVVKFAAGYRETNAFSISRGKSGKLIEYLKNTRYAGIPIYEELPRPAVAGKSVALLFTSGNTVLSEIRPDFEIPTFVITTNRKANFRALEDVALYSDGALIPVFTMSTKEALTRLETFVAEESVKQYATTLTTISGVVSYKEEPIQGAVVALKGTFTSAYTDGKGRYEIEAEAGDVLEVSFPGMERKEWVVKDINNITLKAKSEILGTVTIATKKNSKKQKVDSPEGRRNTDAIGYKYTTILGENIRPNAITLGDVLQGIAALEVRKDPFNPSVELYVFPRTYYQPPYQPPIVVLDGAIYTQGGGVNNIPFIDPQNIKSVSATSSLSATTIYGGIANGGIIRIKTKTGSSEGGIVTKQNSLLATDNDYTEDIKPYAQPLRTYIQALQNAPTAIEAKNRYFKKYHELGIPDLTFFIDSFQFFKKKDPQFAKRIITTLASLAPMNKRVLSTLAFGLEDLKEEKLMVRLREHMSAIAPNDIQSSRNLAAAYLANKEYQKSFETYKKILLNEVATLDQKPLQQIAETELQHLISLHKSKVSYEDLPNELLKVNFKKKVRIVFEWNDPKAAFEVQFVSPEKKFFTWSHDPKVRQEDLAEEAQKGYAIKEFEIDEKLLGDWIVNASAAPVGGENNKGMYLKYTVFSNYATQNEEKQIKIIALDDLKGKKTIDVVTVNNSSY